MNNRVRPLNISVNYELDQLNKDEKEELDIPNYEKGRLFANRHALKRFNSRTGYQDYSLCEENEEIGKFSFGVQLYLNFVKSAVFVFFIMSLISIPALISNYTGNGLTENQKGLLTDVFSLANQPAYKFQSVLNFSNLTTQTQNEMIDREFKNIKEFQSDMETRLFFVSVPDIIYTIVFLIFILYLRIYKNRQIKMYNLNNVILTDFAIEVEGFPDTIINENDLFVFFEQFGEIIEVKLARNYFGTLLTHKTQAKYERKFNYLRRISEIKRENNVTKLKKLENKIIALKFKNEIRKKEKFKDNIRHEDYPSIKAFVVFSKPIVRNKVIDLFEKYNNRNLWKYITCYNVDIYMPENLKFKNRYALKTKIPDMPDNILWENIDCPPQEKTYKFIISLMITIFLLFFTFAIVTSATIVQGINPSICETKTILLSNLDKSNEIEVDCFCTNLDLHAIINDPEMRDMCSSFLTKITARFALIIVSGFVIVGVNFLLKISLEWCAKYERYESLSLQTYSSIIKIFLAMFFNTAIITMLMHANIFGFIPTVAFSNMIPPLHDILSQNSGAKFPNDFDRQWYTEVGGKVMISWFINVFSPHCIHFFYVIYTNWKNKKKASDALIQKDVNDSFMKYKYELVTKYAITLNTIFVTLFYCSGMPLMLLCGCVSLLLQYLTEKYLILRHYRRPPYFDWRIHSKIIRILPIAILFHLAIGIYAYGSDNIFPYSVSTQGIKYDFKETLNVLNFGNNSETLYNRCIKILWLFLILLVVVLLYIIDISFINLISCYCCKRKKVNKVSIQGSEISYIQQLKALTSKGLASYDIRINPKYKDLIHTINGDLFIKKETTITIIKEDEENNSMGSKKLIL